MILLLDGIVIGLLLAVVTGGRTSALAQVHLRGERVLLASLAVSMFAPTIDSSNTLPSTVLLWMLWVTPLLIVIGVLVFNLRLPGLALVLLGIVLNLLVVLANGGMPVSADSVGLVSDIGALQELDQSWLHVLLEPDTAFPFLADVIPIPGPSWHRGVVSLGDLYMSFGLAYMLFMSTHQDKRDNAG